MSRFVSLGRDLHITLPPLVLSTLPTEVGSIPRDSRVKIPQQKKQLHACVPFLPTFFGDLMTWNSIRETDVTGDYPGNHLKPLEFFGQETTSKPERCISSIRLVHVTVQCRTTCYKYMAQAACIFLDLTFGRF